MAIEKRIGGRGSEQSGAAHAFNSRMTTAIDALGGFLSWIFDALRRGRGLAPKRKQMQLVESLPLGNRRQLLLVLCDGERYLVGAGADCVGSILAIEQRTIPVEQPRPAPEIPAGAISYLGKRPELVRRRVRQIPSEPKPGADRWQ